MNPTSHAEDKTITEYYEKGVDVPVEYLSRTITLNRDGIVEVGFDSKGNLNHVLYREPYNDEWDIVYAIKYPEGILKTFWLNRSSDRHSTLDKSLYSMPKVWYRLKPTFDLLYR